MIIVLKCTVLKMESHTLEILHQGVWASLTGGWFYDLRQNVFCNTFHLYLWLFLLCFPFILHLYFTPNIVMYSFYCGTVGVLFSVLKFVNHRLHILFDTSESVVETVPGEDLPESQKKKVSGTQTAVEDEGIELQVLSGSKTADVGVNVSLNEQTDEDSIMSLEVGARAASSTIDLKVDVHRKNSSESSEELSVKPILEGNSSALGKEEDLVLKKQSQMKTPDSVRSGLRCKFNKLNNSKLRSKVEEGIKGVEEDDFALSQSDCHIAKLRKENMEELSEEYKMSQSDCQISNLRQSMEENNSEGRRTEWATGIPTHFNSKDAVKRKRRRAFYKNLHSNSQTGRTRGGTDKNKSFDMGDLASNGSCGVLPLNQTSTKEQIKNTGSLELPLQDAENASSSEKGLLYWKQQNLDRVRGEKLRQSQSVHPCESRCSETSIHSSDFTCPDNTPIRLNKASSLGENNGSSLELNENDYPLPNQSEESNSRIEPAKEKSFLQILEENFDWYGSEFQSESNENSGQPSGKVKEQKYKSEEAIKEEELVEDKRNSSLKFQVDSDEESSDNCGSRSPLLCRHESLEKDSRSPPVFPSGEKTDKKIPRTHSNEEKHPRGFAKISRTLSVDENVVLSKKVKSNSGLEKNSLSSFLLTVYDDSEKRDKEGGSGDAKEERKSVEFPRGSGKPFAKRESFLHRNKKLSLPGENVTKRNEEPPEGERRKGEDVFSSASDRVGLDWLFEHTDSETENPRASFWKYTYSEDSDNTSLEFLSDQQECSCSSSTTDLPKAKSSLSNKDVRPLQNQGAIPKTRSRHSEVVLGKRNGHQRLTKKGDLKYNLYPEDYVGSGGENGGGKGRECDGKKKVKAERENGIIDEEDVDTLQEIVQCKKDDSNGQSQKGRAWRETYDSSSSSTTELSSLLPLSSLLSSLNPPASPLLAAFLTTRKEVVRGNPSGAHGDAPEKDGEAKEDAQSIPYSRNRHKRHKRSVRSQRTSRSSRVSSLPLAALSSLVSTTSGTHIAISHDDTSQGAVHCFQDESGNWMSYTFDNSVGSVAQLPVPLQGACQPAKASLGHVSNSTNRNGKNAFANNSNFKSGNNDSAPNFDGSKFLPPNLRSPYVLSRSGDANLPAFLNSRAIEESARQTSQQPDRRKPDQPRGSAPPSVQPRNKNQKPTETWDSNINLVSNSNSENESSLSLNSTVVSPNADLSATRSAFVAFVRERFLANQRTLGMIPNANPGSNSNSTVLSLNEFRNNDTNNNNNNMNNNNNNNNNNEDNTAGQGGFYTSGLVTTSVRLPFELPSETHLDRTRRRVTTWHCTQALLQNSQLSTAGGTQILNDQGMDQHHFQLFDFEDVEQTAEAQKKPRQYYKLYYTPWNFLKIRFDRLDLMALLDRNLTVFEILLSLFLSVAVSVCGIVLLNHGFYQDLFAFMFCFSLAGCQYSLLKSVQPDATSPTHGYNRVVIYSRSIYFCITSLLILLLTENLSKDSDHSFEFYSIQFSNNNLIRTVRDGLVNLLLVFPVLFTLGLFPQINTFSLYLLEQIDMHVFGGNAMCSLVGAVYCILRSVVTTVFVYGFAYGALSEAKASQHILFSIFCGLLISLSYHLSRSSGNPAIIWDILKNHLFQDELESKSTSKECAEKKMKKTELDKSVDESLKSEVNTKTEGDEKSEDRNSHNNLLLNSNPSSNEMLKGLGSQMKPTFSDNFENMGSRNDLGGGKKKEEGFVDPLPGKLKQTVNARLKNDAIVCSFVALLVFGIHCSTVFTALQPDLNSILWGIAGCSGIVLHYVVPELRKHLPWLCLAKPVLKCREHGQFEVKDAAKVMWFEETYVLLCFLERNVLYPVLVLAAVTYDGPKICNKLGVPVGALITSICGLKVMRSAFSNTSQQYLIVIFSALLFEFDYHSCSETFLVDYFFMGIVFAKTYEFLLKIQFVVIYIAPWQITWGSAFHAFAQPFSVPHSAMLFLQAALSAFLSAPLNPFLGSAVFLASYVRPIKFWERDYNTRRVDHSNTRLSSHLERNLGSDDNNLNSIFYEHLTRSLQHSLCGDLELGRWGPVYQGDCFVLASDYLNCLVHIIEMGNGLVTFQMRGLEFRGTYCQQREVEAISERVEEDEGCCCCEPGHIPYILSVNAAFSKRWLAWEVTAAKYVLEGYSISDNAAASTLQAFDFRKVLVTYYVKSIIYYCVTSPKLYSWLMNPTLIAALEPLFDKVFVDLDPVFNVNIDQDFDIRAEGITRSSFCNVYLEWIRYCNSKREKPIDKMLENALITLCLALSLMGRRSLGSASHNTVSSVEFFLYGLHALFKGDFRITSLRDDWVFTDMEFLVKVVAPGVRMSLKLHQDHFMSPEEYQDSSALFDAISSHKENLVISHEGDPAWRNAVLSGTPSLLALRHVLDDGTDEYKIIMLNKRFLSFRVIKLNRECVRGLWAGQQQELVFLRNRNPERGSIQNAKQVLRNMINSSCDQPIGYPIYVSPLTTSYSDTNKQYTGIVGGPLSLQGMKNSALKVWRRIRQRCREGCSSGSAGNVDEGGYSFGHEGIYAMTNINVHSGYGHNTSGSQSIDSSQMQLSSSNRGGSLGRSSLGGRGSLPSVGKPSSTTLASLAGLLSSAELPKGESFLRERETSFTFIKERQSREERETGKKHEERKEEKDKRKEEKEGKKEKERVSGTTSGDHGEETKDKETVYQRVRIIDPNLVFDAINLGRRIDVLWPDEGMRMKGGRSYWKDWLPDTGMEGQVVHRWVPNHRDPSKRSNVDKTILLIKIEDKYVPIAEAGVQDLGVEV